VLNSSVGYYNTFTGKIRQTYPGLELAVAENSEELLAVRSDFFVGFQFHPESILTKNGDAILKEAVAYLLAQT
jgi:2-amino-4-deoxychorismate synthase